MGTNTVAGKSIEVDEEGFVADLKAWSEDVAKAMAKAGNIRLIPDYWKVIKFVCEYYDERQDMPSLWVLTQAMREMHGMGTDNFRHLLEIYVYLDTRRNIRRVLRRAGPPPKNTIDVSGKRIALDIGGGLKDPSDWGEEVVRAMAKVDSFELTKKHWDTIYRLRQCYEKHQTVPLMKAVTEAFDEWLVLGYELPSSLRMSQALKYASLPYLFWPYPCTIIVSGRRVELDEQGYVVVQLSDWSEDVARKLAWLDNFELTPAHWEIINFMREYSEEDGMAPSPYQLPKAIGKKLGPEKGNYKYLYTLFPDGPYGQAVRYAGLLKQCFD